MVSHSSMKIMHAIRYFHDYVKSCKVSFHIATWRKYRHHRIPPEMQIVSIVNKGAYGNQDKVSHYFCRMLILPDNITRKSNPESHFPYF